MNNVITLTRSNIDYLKILYYNINSKRDIGRLPPSFFGGWISISFLFFDF